jgi:hypothetical protein
LHPFRKLPRFAGFSGARRRLVLEAAFELTRAQLAAALIPFRWLTPGFEMLKRAILDIRWAIGTAASQLPWHSRCLVCTAAKWLLRRRIPSTLYMGVAPGATKPWGGPQHLNYRVPAKFADLEA